MGYVITEVSFVEKNMFVGVQKMAVTHARWQEKTMTTCMIRLRLQKVWLEFCAARIRAKLGPFVTKLNILICRSPACVASSRRQDAYS